MTNEQIMPHTNQLIEEEFEIKRIDGGQTIKELFTGGDMWDWDFAKETIYPVIENLLSQTEQECDKKWRTFIESKRKSVPPIDTSFTVEAVQEQLKAVSDEGYNSALDDLLKQ